LREQNDAFNNQGRILIGSALAESLSARPDERNSIQVRVHDLDYPRSSKIKTLQAATRNDRAVALKGVPMLRVVRLFLFSGFFAT
jgi:hypothetical protein